MGKSPGLKLQASIVQDNVPVEIASRLFVGSIHAAFNVDALKQARITHIVNLAGSYATFPEEFTYLSVSIRDKEYADLLSCLPAILLFVEAALRNHDHSDGGGGGGVLIHCAGGRSRSPAVAMAYLMTAHHVSFDQALLQMLAARPVVSLNAGFEVQLRFLGEAKGDAFAAHQLLLQHRLTALAQQREEGQLDMAFANSTRRPHNHHHSHHHHHGHHHHGHHGHSRHHHHHHSMPRTPTHGEPGCDSERVVAQSGACDERGMLFSRVPIGLSLSLPSAHTKGPQFLPALRSAGTLFGCKSCGDNLFCASTIVNHDHNGKQPRTAVVVDTSQTVVVASEVKSATKRPLLAKLRLRPHSPGVGGGSSKDVKQRGGDSSSSNATPNVITPRTAVLKNVIKKANDTPPASPLPVPSSSSSSPPPPLLPPSPQQPPSQQQQMDAVQRGDGTIQQPRHMDEKGSRDSSFWRTLASFKSSSKRHLKDTSSSGGESHTTDDDKKKKAVASPKTTAANAIDLSAAATQATDDEIAQAKFLHDNKQQWERKLRVLEQSCRDNKKSSEAASPITRLVERDAQLMAQLERCDQWFIEPPQWLLTAANLEQAKGPIVCPNAQCAVALGQWCWDGLPCDCGCGHVVTPAFQLNKHALRTLGTVVDAPAQMGDSRGSFSDTIPLEMTN